MNRIGSQHKKKITYFLTPWSRVLLEKLTGSQLVKLFPAFYGTHSSVVTLISVHYLPLPDPDQSSP
jgi:hypothetical protein